MERDAKDKFIAEFLLDNQLKTEEIFTEALRRAQASGELSDKQDPTALARFFVATIQGMRAMAKLNSNREALEQVASDQHQDDDGQKPAEGARKPSRRLIDLAAQPTGGCDQPIGAEWFVVIGLAVDRRPKIVATCRHAAGDFGPADFFGPQCAVAEPEEE